jgi:hypothetical protein
LNRNAASPVGYFNLPAELVVGLGGQIQAWLYVAIVASAYVISRGLAKSGSREPYDEDADRDKD